GQEFRRIGQPAPGPENRRFSPAPWERNARTTGTRCLRPAPCGQGRGIVMLRMQSEAPRGLRWGAFSLALLVAMTAVSSDPADARSRRKRGAHNHRAAHSVHNRGAKRHRAIHHSARSTRSDSLAPGYSDTVVDG